MIDFLKANPSVTKDQYMWDWTVPQILLAACDNTHIEYLSEEQAKIDKARRNAIRVDRASMLNDLGIPVFGSQTNDKNE